jgi:hypothetical protein
MVWQRLLERSGARCLLHSSVIGADVEDGAVQRVRVAGCSREMEISARWFIDATGEGDLSALAGGEFMKGDPGAGRCLHMSLTCTLADTGKTVPSALPDDVAPIRDESELPGLRASLRLPDGRVYVNMTKVMGRDPTDPWELSAAEMEARRQLARVVDWLQRTRFPTCVLVSSGATIGIREGRRVLGEYVLTETDVTGEAPRDFEDGVAVATSQIDFHSLTRPGHAGWRRRVHPYAIPLRCLMPRGLSNVLVAGKCISGEQTAQSSYRMTPTCCAMGQAAGTAAAMAVDAGLEDVRSLDVGALRSALKAGGMELDPSRHESFSPEETPDRSERL